MVRSRPAGRARACVVLFSRINLHERVVVVGGAFERLVIEGVHAGPCQIGVAGFIAAAGDIGHVPPTWGEGFVDGHEGLRDIRPAGVKLQPPLADDVFGF